MDDLNEEVLDLNEKIEATGMELIMLIEDEGAPEVYWIEEDLGRENIDAPWKENENQYSNEDVLGLEKIEASWNELITKNGNPEAPEQCLSPMWIPVSQIAFIAEAPLSNNVRIEIPTTNHQLKALTKNDSAILKCLMKSTNTVIRTKLPLIEEEPITLSICGPPTDVHRAKRELVNYMPIDIIFDIDRAYLDIKKIVSVAFNNCLALAGVKKTDSILRITMRGEESMVQTMYKVYQEIREILARVECWPSFLRIIRHAVELNTSGIFDDLNLEDVVPAKIKTDSNAMPTNDAPSFYLPTEEVSLIAEENERFVLMPTPETYEDVLRDEEWWIVPKRKTSYENPWEDSYPAASKVVYFPDNVSHFNPGTSHYHHDLPMETF